MQRLRGRYPAAAPARDVARRKMHSLSFVGGVDGGLAGGAWTGVSSILEKNISKRRSSLCHDIRSTQVRKCAANSGGISNTRN